MTGYEHPWRVRVSARTGPVGAGVLVASDAVLTCAHVVASALAADPPATGAPSVDPAGPAPAGTVTVDFPGSTVDTPVSTMVSAWVPVAAGGGGDLALLCPTGQLPGDVRPARLRYQREAAGRRVRAFGYPAGLSGGVWTRGELVGAGGPWRGWVQVDGLGGSGRPVSAGFSGAGVVDDESGSVLGILVASDRQRETRVAWMIPAAVIAEQLPLPGAPTAAGPAPVAHQPVAHDLVTRRPSTADLQRLARALAAVPVIANPATRQQVVRGLRPAIANTAPRYPETLVDLYSILQTCLDHPGGLTELMSVIRGFESDSTSANAVGDLIDEMGLDGT
jgi:hypothetical protein